MALHPRCTGCGFARSPQPVASRVPIGMARRFRLRDIFPASSTTRASESMADIFICYRREDTEAYAGRLHDSLVGTFGERSVFIDVDNLHPGVDFDHVIQSTLGRTKVVLVMIGPRWLGTRIANDQDFVRREILAALKGRKRVIPILVGGTPMPSRERVPSDLAALVQKNAVVLNHASWKHDVARLIRSLEKFIGGTRSSATKPAPKKKVATPKTKSALRGSSSTTPKKAPRKRAAAPQAEPPRIKEAPKPGSRKSPRKPPVEKANNASTKPQSKPKPKPKPKVGKTVQAKQATTVKVAKAVGTRVRRGGKGKGGAHS